MYLNFKNIAMIIIRQVILICLGYLLITIGYKKTYLLLQANSHCIRSHMHFVTRYINYGTIRFNIRLSKNNMTIVLKVLTEKYNCGNYYTVN